MKEVDALRADRSFLRPRMNIAFQDCPCSGTKLTASESRFDERFIIQIQGP